MKKYLFKTTSNVSTIPVTDGEFFTDAIEGLPTKSEVYYEFYSDIEATTTVTPTAGTITAYGSPLGNNFLLAGSDAETDCTKVETGISTYTPPIIDGLNVRSKIVLLGITDAAYVRAVLYTHS